MFATYFAAEALTFVKQYDSFGMKANIPLFGSLGITPPVLFKAQGPAALGVIQSSNYVVDLDHAENQVFRDAYKKKFNEDPEEFSVMGYDAMRFIIEAVKVRNGDTKDRPGLVSARRRYLTPARVVRCRWRRTGRPRRMSISSRASRRATATPALRSSTPTKTSWTR